MLSATAILVVAAAVVVVVAVVTQPEVQPGSSKTLDTF